MLLNPREVSQPLAFCIDESAINRDLILHWPDPSVHVHHCSYLAAEKLPGRRHTLPAEAPWPLPQAYIGAVLVEEARHAAEAEAVAGAADAAAIKVEVTLEMEVTSEQQAATDENAASNGIAPTEDRDVTESSPVSSVQNELA